MQIQKKWFKKNLMELAKQQNLKGPASYILKIQK
jgi:hypothetical protein